MTSGDDLMVPRPVQGYAPELLLRAQPVEVLLLDVDGVLTDGGLYYTEAGETLKRFHTLDGHGIKLLARAGVTPVVVTGRDSAALRGRLQGLGVVHARFGTEDKRGAAEAILSELGKAWSVVAAMGDDWPDLPVLRRAALAACPPGAHPEVLAQAHYVTQRAAGAGAVREVCDLLLTARGVYASLLEEACR
jgi:3-deoxy-D-manno-octulosonate 8-phosphate phosphatase (KDO 8-P phosphatase)